MGGSWPGFLQSVEVHNCPTKMEMANGPLRPRQDAMDELVDELKIPPGTIVYLEQGGARPGFGAQASYVQGGNCPLWKGSLCPINSTVAWSLSARG
jgi:hypothetical protein